MRNDSSFNLGAAALITILLVGALQLVPLGMTTGAEALEIFTENKTFFVLGGMVVLMFIGLRWRRKNGKQ